VLTEVQRGKIRKLAEAIMAGDRVALSRGITLVESLRPHDATVANALLLQVLHEMRSSPVHHRTFRVGFSGPPGTGKSSFIEALGMELVERDYKVAVLTVDPSSERSGGSILGDKTRMINLSRNHSAYVRTSPTWGTLGGLARATSEAMILCEAAGYNVVFVETVGVGQSEIMIADTVDMVALLVPPTAGDELQGIKKGIVEVADMVIVNKADGDLLPAARITKADYMHALQLVRPKYKIWKTPVMMTSTKSKDPDVSVTNAWEAMNHFEDTMHSRGQIMALRGHQRKRRLWSQMREEFMGAVKNEKGLRDLLQKLEAHLDTGDITPRWASRRLLREFLRKGCQDPLV
jgi:GTPase